MGKDWFKSLTCAERGLFFQLLLLCKMGDDNGHICVSGMSDLASTCGLHRSTCAKFVTKLAHLSTLVVSKNQHGSLDIFLPKYVEYQEMTAQDVHKKMRNRVEKPTRKTRQREQTKPDQTRPEQTTAPLIIEEPKDNRKPIEKFNQWIEKNQADDLTDMIKAALGVTREGLLHESEWKWAKHQIDKMRVWIIGNPDKEKKKWGRFIANWLNTAASDMTEKDEDVWKIRESRERGPSEPTKIGDQK